MGQMVPTVSFVPGFGLKLKIADTLDLTRSCTPFQIRAQPETKPLLIIIMHTPYTGETC
jgi:hypothetical protein